MATTEDRVLAKPADLCCLKGSIHTGEQKGVIESINGVDTYVSKPNPDTANNNVILFFPDAFGLHINSFLMMDSFAACGYLVLGVDYFLGDAVTKHSKTPLSDPNFDFQAWRNKHLPSSEEVAVRWVKDVHAKYGKDPDTKFACVGYCWGARFVCSQLSKTGICKVGAVAHPSFMMESHVSGIEAPIFFSVPNTDALFVPESRSRTIEILTEANRDFNMQIFSKVGHGFATRAFLSDPYERWAKEQSFKSFVDWIDHWLSEK
ncbi:hypothetical protein A1O1_07258 [Capronia coronata CBS 617.96]|uniref:Dienelactone hydrolase domain-containing protein n=1 Tax=Capronia coronata CBS 617.96 TaxID=1182541 RepID=W9YMZ0_9EURO|nr:uncharacterized protein A1O1_07258 [Capronia coronata CBS 617.96]EXJ83634.1 hypothetical protein A1O1_07258 [Capronia coronata CBS 617.96]